MQMAQEDNTAAVDMLINEFNMNPEDAIEGYARAKRGDLVTSLLQKHKGGDRAIRAYAYTGQVDAMNVMLNFGASMRSAAYGAGRAGNIELLHDLISRSNARINVIKHAMSGLIHSDHIDDAEALIFHCIQIFDQIDDAWRDALNVFDTKESHVKKTDHLPDLTTTAIEAYSQAHYFSDEFKLTKLLASTKDQKIFNVFAHFAKQISSQNDKYNFRGITTAEIIHKASLLRLAMLDKKISFDEALTSGIANAKPDPKPTLLSRIHLFKKPAAVNAQPAVMSPASAEATPATDSTVNAEAATEAALH